MNSAKFCAAFEAAFPPSTRDHPTRRYALRLNVTIKRVHLKYDFFDPLRNVEGMISVKKQRLLHLAYAHLPPDEAYLEIGTWQGKSLIAAMRGNPPRKTFACDNFSEWQRSKGQSCQPGVALRRNLQRYGLSRSVIFYEEPLHDICTEEKLPCPLGAYFYDGAHDEHSQYAAIKLIEPFLAEEALVIIDDWRFAGDSQSYAKAGTARALAESVREWRLLYELPSRYNGDRAMWWNGLAVFACSRRGDRASSMTGR